MAIRRPQLTDEQILKAIELLTQNIGKRLETHGRGAFVSSHEGLGIIVEEYHELLEAVRGNDPYRVAEELMDVAVGCVIAVASMVAGSEVREAKTCTCGSNEGCTDCPVVRAPQEGDIGMCISADNCCGEPGDCNNFKRIPMPTNDVDAAAARAREMMIERARQSGIVIPD